MDRLSARVSAAVIAAFALVVAGGASASAAPSHLRVGSRTLTLCGTAPPVYCGRLSVPLHDGNAGPRISIAFRWYPARGGEKAARGTVVPVEGGPGYGSTGSAPEGFVPMYGPLLRRWNLLVVDNRGTGQSAAINCPALQGFSGPTGTGAFEQAGAQCAAELDATYGPHASDLFSSASAADDMASIIEALRAGPVDIYGDSYGSFYAQVFAVHHPRLVRSVILDSTYPIEGLDPWYRSSHDAMPADFSAVCARWAPCASREPLGTWARIAELAAALRRAPLSAVVPGFEGRRESVSMDVVGLVDLVNDAAGDPVIYAEIDAAARAALSGRPAPLLRLYAQRLAYDENYFNQSPHAYSAGLYLAVSCVDYPQLFDMQAPPAQREEQLAAAQASLPAETFAPFTVGEWISQDQNTEAYSACLRWPAPAIAQPPAVGSPPLLPSHLPVLILGGELDSWTPPGDVSKVQAYLGGTSRFVRVANATHVVGETDTPCASRIVRAFVAQPSRLASLPVGCAAEPPIHAVGEYPASLASTAPVRSRRLAPLARRLAAGALVSAADAAARISSILGSKDAGLYGGRVSAPRPGAVVLEGDQLIPGVRVSGRLSIIAAPRESERERFTARLTVQYHSLTMRLVARWSARGGRPASITGSFAGRRFTATAPAP